MVSLSAVAVAHHSALHIVSSVIRNVMISLLALYIMIIMIIISRDFLAKGSPPFYIGFGSIVIDKPTLFSRIVVEGVEKAGVRTIIHQGMVKE